MKVTIVVSTLTAGGAERAAVNMANHWAARGWQPTILTTSQRGRPIAFHIDPRVKVVGIDWRRPPNDDDLDRASVEAILGGLDMHDPACDPLIADLVILALLRRAILLTRPDTVISMIHLMNIRMLAATAGLPFRRFVSERCDPWVNTIHHWERARRRFYAQADGVITQTADASRYFERFGAKCHAIPNVVMAPPAGERESRPTRTLIALARLVAFKRLNLIIRAFAHIADEHPDWRLDIWGEGEQRPFLESVIRQVGTNGRIRLRGHAHDIYPVLRSSDLFAMASTTEGFPNALCEAMACGVPAVVIDCGAGVREIVRDGVDGLIVQANGPAQYGEALSRLMRDDAERARLAARAPEIVERFSEEKVMARWDEVLA